MHLLVLNEDNSHVTFEVVKSVMNYGLDIISLPSYTSHVLQALDVSCFKPFKYAFRQIRDFWTVLNNDKKVEKTILCEWTSQALERSLIPKNIKSDFKKTGIWPLDDIDVTNRMEPNREFKEGGQKIQPLGEEDSNKNEFGDNFKDDNPVQLCDDLGNNSHDLPNMVIEAEINSQTESARHERSSRICHFYVDVSNPEENNYDLNDKHIIIDPEFREELKRRNDSNINEFLSLPELILTKKRRKQQPLLDYTKNIILTSRDYIKGLEELLAKEDATAAAAQKKNEEKEASKEQCKLQQEQRQKEKQDHAAQKAQKKQKREMQQLTKRRYRGTADHDDTIAGANEFPSTSDTPNAVQQGTNGLHSLQQAIMQQWTLLQPSFLPPMQPAMTPPPANMSIPLMMQEVPRGFHNTHTSPFYSSAYNDVTPQPPR